MRLLFKVNTKILKIGYSNMLIKQLMKIERCWFNLKHGGYISAVTVLPQMFAKAMGGEMQRPSEAMDI
jgi:hypothetical protein